MLIAPLFVVVLGLVAAPSTQQGGLGVVSFPTSSSSAAQPHIERGVALLHSFQYDEAALEFDTGLLVDTSCAMCHWGKAMTRFHPLWGEWPTTDSFQRGREDLMRAQQTGARTARERGYLAAAAAFFNAPPSTTRRGRLRAYVRQFAVLHRQEPDDDEAASFYALSLLALGADGVDDLSNRRRAIETLEVVLRRQPRHPGAVHYLIHATDRPDLAARGLAAARAYADIAPDSSHALHMPSHIFVRLGMWPEAIATNLRAAVAGAQAVIAHHGDYTYQIHALEFLNYAYLQWGLEAKAREQHNALSTVPGASDEEKLADRASFEARAAVELHRWEEAAALPLPALDPSWLADAYWARTIGAARLHNVADARTNLAKFTESQGALVAGMGAGAHIPPAMRIALLEAEAWVAFAEGRDDAAVTLLRQAAKLDASEVGESVVVPAREMLADLLLDLRRPAEAKREYDAVLRAAPNRFNALLGAARASDAVGARTSAQASYRRLIEMVAPDADREELREARASLEQR